MAVAWVSGGSRLKRCRNRLVVREVTVGLKRSSLAAAMLVKGFVRQGSEPFRRAGKEIGPSLFSRKFFGDECGKLLLLLRRKF